MTGTARVRSAFSTQQLDFNRAFGEVVRRVDALP